MACGVLSLLFKPQADELSSGGPSRCLEISKDRVQASHHFDTASTRGHFSLFLISPNEELASAALKPKRSEAALADRIESFRASS